jgi:hypothetical protein
MKPWQVLLLVVGVAALTGGVVYFAVRSKGGGAAPTAPAAPGTPGAAPGSKEAAPPPVLQGKAGKTYRHTIGFEFWHPGDWTVKLHDDFLELAPPDQARNADGPTEVYAIIGDSVAGSGISVPSDPRVGEYLDKVLKGLSPTLQRSGQTASVPTSGGQGALLEWAGKTPKGQELVARAYACILRQHGVALVALGLREPLAGREADLRRIFASFTFGSGDRDAAMVGAWALTSSCALRNESPFETSWSRAQMASERQSRLVFSADGSWTRTDRREMLAGAGGVWIEDKSEKSSAGTWNAGGGRLYMMWKDGSWDDFQYRLETEGGKRRLRLAGSGRGEVWEPAR